MKVHEYQAKEIFAKYGIPVPTGQVAQSPQEVRQAAAEIGCPVMIKSQVHVGGRGKAGGIKMAQTPEEAESLSGEILGMKIKGLEVSKVLVTQAIDIDSEGDIDIVSSAQVADEIAWWESIFAGIDEESSPPISPQLKLTCTPNPFSTGTRIELLGASLEHPVELKVYDVNGRLVLGRLLATSTYQLGTTLSPGIYFLEIDGVVRQKIIKIR